MNRFREIENRFQELKENHERGIVSAEEFKTGLKKLVIRDSKGVLWSLGEKSGKWYYYNERQWIEGYPEEGRYVECPQCQTQNLPGSKVCSQCGGFLEKKEWRCPGCSSIINANHLYCPYCGVALNKLGEQKSRVTAVDHVTLSSAFVFFGGVGLFLGIVLGAYLGVTHGTLAPLEIRPPFFKQIRGGMTGGLLFGVAGAMAGFVVGAISGLFLSLFYNLTAFLFGGLAFRFRERRKTGEPRSAE